MAHIHSSFITSSYYALVINNNIFKNHISIVRLVGNLRVTLFSLEVTYNNTIFERWNNIILRIRFPNLSTFKLKISIFLFNYLACNHSIFFHDLF